MFEVSKLSYAYLIRSQPSEFEKGYGNIVYRTSANNLTVEGLQIR